ncbi:MAG: extracellular solute-binding protein [Elusimicrobia bacterium]|nr:extracellular solute-binding protein [Elusimicrobiota bacterium]
MIKRNVLLMVLIFLVSGFFSCTKKTEDTGQIKIVFWEWWADKHKLLEKFAKEYEEKTGIKVIFELTAPVGQQYFNKLQAAAQADTLPDIIGIAATGEFLARYITAGKIVELTEEMDKGWKDWFYGNPKEEFYYLKNQWGVKPDSCWCVPISAINIQIYYNKELFKKAGLDPENPPKTWDEFIAAGKKLKSAGIAPFTSGFGDLWMNGVFIYSYAWSYLGKNNIEKTIKGQYPYTSPGWNNALRKVVEMRDAGMFVDGIVTLPNKESERLFANGDVAMALNGSWAVNVYKQMNSDLNFGVMKPPKDPKAKYPLYLAGGLGAAAAVTTCSKYPEEAIKFLKWFTHKDQQIRYSKEGNELSANKNTLEGLPPVLAKNAEGLNNLTPKIHIAEKYEVEEVLFKGIQSILIKEKTPEEVLKEVQKKKEKIIKK